MGGRVVPRAAEGPRTQTFIPGLLHSLPHSCGFEQEGEASWSSEKGPGELEKSNTLEVSLRLEDHLFPPRLG